MIEYKKRRLLQLISLLLWVLAIYLISRGIFLVQAHSVCPFSVVCFSAPLMINGVATFLLAMIAGLIIALSSVFLSRWFCSYICFFGTVQELLFLVKKQKKKNKNYKMHKFLSGLKYLVLAVSFTLSFFFLGYIIYLLCPAMSISQWYSFSAFSLFALVIIFVIGFFNERFWCKYLCPYAALMNLFVYLGKILRLPALKIHRNMEICVDCYQCNMVCPMDIDILSYERVTDPNCIICDKCIDSCPKDKALIKKITN